LRVSNTAPFACLGLILGSYPELNLFKDKLSTYIRNRIPILNKLSNCFLKRELKGAVLDIRKQYERRSVRNHFCLYCSWMSNTAPFICLGLIFVGYPELNLFKDKLSTYIHNRIPILNKLSSGFHKRVLVVAVREFISFQIFNQDFYLL